MHLTMVMLAMGLALGVHGGWRPRAGSWSDRWHWALGSFLFPPVLLLTTACAILWMGPHGAMVGRWGGWLSYGLSWLLMGWGAIAGLIQLITAWQSWRQVRTYEAIALGGHQGRLLETHLPFSAQIGFWRSELVISQGLLDMLDPEHLEAVLTHEAGHAHYRDTFWFFWLGWLRRLTAWLPRTEALWQELLALRELRADHWAAQQVDRLALAESLLAVVSAPLHYSEDLCAAFSCSAPPNRLQERIEALLFNTEERQQTSLWQVSLWLGCALLPLMTVPFHH